MNIPKSNLVVGQEAFNRLYSGFKLGVDGIRPLYGPNGTNSLNEEEFYPYHRSANDAQTNIQATEILDPEARVERIGLGLIKELMNRADKTSKDGRKTTALIADAIISESFKHDIPKMQLKRDLDALIPLVESSIDSQKSPIGIENIGKVAAVAGESEKLGSMIQEIYGKIGKDGVIHIEASDTPITSYSVTDGVKFDDAGFLSKNFVHDPEAKKAKIAESRAVYEHPAILVTKRKINHLNDINPLIDALQQKGKDLVIFTDDMDSGVAKTMVKAHTDGIINILIIKAPILWKNYVFEDFAKCVGATVLEDASGIDFKSLGLYHLGMCERLTTDESETTLQGIADITDHVNYLKSKGDNDSLIRLQWLNTKTATLRIGSNSETELSYLLLKAEDAKNSARLALIDGVVVGGGLSLHTASLTMPETAAGSIMRSALLAPYAQLCVNADKTTLDVSDEVLDASMVVKNAVRNAVGLVSTMLTTSSVIFLPPKSPEQIAAEVLAKRGIRM